jgi:hypothetical protein
MKAKLHWLCVLPLTVAALFFVLFGVALGQGPVLTTLPTPTPMPLGPEVASSADLGAQDTLPDLIVEKIETGPATPLVGQPSVISVTIKNQGPGSVHPDNNFLVDLYIDPPRTPVVNYHQIVSPTLGLPWGAQWWFVETPGTSYVFTTTWVFTDVKTFDVWAQVDSNGESVEDSDGNVTEANEGNNTKKASVIVLSADYFRHDTHQDFLTNMASTLDNSDPNGALQLGLFTEPPVFYRPFADGSCQITSGVVSVSDYNMETPDARINQVMTGTQAVPHLIANGEGVVIAVWQDGRNGEINNPDIYLRYSTDEGETWGPELRVNDDIGYAEQLNPAAALSEDGNLLVAWQDRRSGVDYDIYAQRFLISGTNLIPSVGNIEVREGGDHIPGDQINPDIAVDEAGGFYVVWQDNRYGNYDIFTTSYISTTGSYAWSNVTRVNDDPNQTQQSNPAINVINWAKVTDIAYEVGPGPDYEVTVTQIFTQPVTVLAVIWEDYRKQNADIAIAISTDGGTTFGFDDFINDDADPGDPPDPLAPDQLDPDVTLTKDKTTATISVPLPSGQTAQVEVEVPVTGIHTVWQDYRNGPLDPDIYYSLSQFGVKQAQADENFDPELFLGGNAKINQNDGRDWQTTPVEQGNPTITAYPCGGDADETGWNVFIAWSDGRNYDSFNYDIYYTVRSTCEGMPSGLASNLMLNDGVRLYNFDTSNPSYDDYDAGNPPPARQLHPSVAADIQTDWPYVLGGYLYLAWEDDRAGNPQAQWDIYFARSNLTFFNHHVPDVISGTFGYGAGSQISNILDSESDDTIWYTVDWSAATDDSTYLTVQTRLGDTIADVLNSAWYPQRFPYQPQWWDCAAYESGAPLPGYNAPGQHIENASGRLWPQARYIQYRVNFYTRESTNTPVLDNLTIYFDNGIRPGDGGNGVKSYIYLPMVLK